ncbi:MAG: Eco57I restriction-modification methylase domain-containing protein, partial [Gemmatimonadota bacterium]
MGDYISCMQNARPMSSWTEFDLNNSVAARRASASGMLSDLERRRLGQYFTPLHVARFIASLSRATGETIRILDPGAGVGSLFAAAVDALCSAKNPPRAIRVTAVEVDQLLHSHLADTIAECEQPCGAIDFDFFGEIVASNYLEVGVDMLAAQMAFDAKEPVEFDIVIANPPYRKINASSLERRRLQQIGIETGNLYSAFLAISALLLREGGELVAITPRSFCNGSYFRPFREMFLRSMRFTRIHVLESRSEAFGDDDVLQENVIFHAVKGGDAANVRVTSGGVTPDGYSFGREISYDELVYPGDRD